MDDALAIIPARYESSRFLGKPLALIGDRPMIEWVYRAASRSTLLNKVIVATDNSKIADAVHAFGGEVMMTDPSHKSGTDRILEVATKYKQYNIIVNIQGDEPGIEPDLIDSVIRLKMEHPEWAVTTAARPFKKDEDEKSSDRVKVVITKQHRALYFSRSLIPYFRNQTNSPIYLHLGIYAYDREYLLKFPQLPNSLLEDTESLEQLRVLENDAHIGVALTEFSSPGVDTPEDLNRIIHLFKSLGKI